MDPTAPTAFGDNNYYTIGQHPYLFWVSIGHSPYSDGRHLWATPFRFNRANATELQEGAGAGAGAGVGAGAGLSIHTNGTELLYYGAVLSKPNGKMYGCGPGCAAACNGPDWMPIYVSFGAGASDANASITIDGTAGACTGETIKVAGSSVTFPTINGKTDCLGLLITSTGALTGDLVITYDSAADTMHFEVDSEGVTETLQGCHDGALHAAGVTLGVNT